MKCKCDAKILESQESTLICTGCGQERYILTTCNFNNCGFQMKHSPFLTGYSRTKRFRQMTEMLFFPCPSNPDAPALQFLTDHKHEIKCTLDIAHLLSSSELPDKRFCSMHMFSRIYSPDYAGPPKYGDLFRMLDKMVFIFQKIELRYKQSATDKPFINYTYIIRHILTKLEFLYYLQFVKILKCAKRKERYRVMLESFKLYD